MHVGCTDSKGSFYITQNVQRLQKKNTVTSFCEFTVIKNYILKNCWELCFLLSIEIQQHAYSICLIFNFPCQKLRLNFFKPFYSINVFDLFYSHLGVNLWSHSFTLICRLECKNLAWNCGVNGYPIQSQWAILTSVLSLSLLSMRLFSMSQ